MLRTTSTSPPYAFMAAIFFGIRERESRNGKRTRARIYRTHTYTCHSLVATYTQYGRLYTTLPCTSRAEEALVRPHTYTTRPCQPGYFGWRTAKLDDGTEERGTVDVPCLIEKCGAAVSPHSLSFISFLFLPMVLCNLPSQSRLVPQCNSFGELGISSLIPFPGCISFQYEFLCFPLPLFVKLTREFSIHFSGTWFKSF